MRCKWMVVAALLAALPLSARAASQDFNVVNRTGYQIDSIYVTELGNRNWGNNVLGTDKLEAGESVDVSFARDARQCHWNLMVKYHDATQATWNDLDLCKLSQVALFWDGKLTTTVARAR